MRDNLCHSSLERDFQDLMQAHGYSGALPRMSNTPWYVATTEDNRLNLLIFLPPTLQCAAQDY